MPNLPAVFVELKATTASFTSSFDAAKKTVNDFSSQSTTGLQKFEQLGKVAFAAIGASAVTFGALAVKAALDGEAAHAQLVQAVTNSGTAFDSVSGKVDSMSDKFAKLGFTNDEVEAALARLVTGTGSTSVALANMGLAADLARGRNISLEDASNALGKVLAGNLKGMMAFGLSAKDASGNTLTAAQAVAELNSRFGGDAAAQADTYAGRLKALHTEFSNLQEAIGNQILPVLAHLASGTVDVVQWADRHREVIGVLAGLIGGPLAGAMTVYIAKQAIAFGQTVAANITSIGRAVFGLVPAIEAAEGAESGLATTTAIATGGLSILGAGIGLVAAHFLGHASATKDAATAATDAAGSMDGLVDAEGKLGGAVSNTNNPLKAQADLFAKLNGDSDAQQSEILKLIGDQNALDGANQKLKDSTGANSEVTKQATQHTKDLAAANKEVKDAADAVTSALNKQAAAKKKLDDLMKPQTERNITDAVDAHEAANDRLTRANVGVKDKTNDLTAAIAEYGAGSEEATLAQLDLNDALREQHDAANAVTDTTQQLGDAQRITIGTTDEIKDATGEYNDATNAVTDAQGKQKDAQGKLNDVLANSGAVKAARDDTKNLADNTLAWQQATATLNSDWTTLQKTLADPANAGLRAELIGQLVSLKNALPKGADTSALDALLDKLKAPVPPNSLISMLSQTQTVQIAGDTGNITLGTTPAPTSAPKSPTGMTPSTTDVLSAPRRAAGGPVFPGQTYVVGEDGPEVLRMGSMAGSVIPNSAGGTSIGSVTIVIAPGNYDEDTLANKVRDKLIMVGRNNVGIGLG